MYLSGSYADVLNCIFWNNDDLTGGTSSNEIYCLSEPSVNVMYSDVEGVTYATQLGNISSDPEFDDGGDGTEPAGDDGIFGTIDDELQLTNNDTTTSPCIDVANGDFAPAMDILGISRKDIDGVSGGEGTPDYADMGAYEACERIYIVVMCWTDESENNYFNEGQTGQDKFDSDLAALDELLGDFFRSKESDYYCMLACYAPLPSGQPYTNNNLGDIFPDDYFVGTPPSNYTLEGDYAEIYVDEFERANPTTAHFTTAFDNLIGDIDPDYIILTVDVSGSMNESTLEGSGEPPVAFSDFKDGLAADYPDLDNANRIIYGASVNFDDEQWIKAIKEAISKNVE